MLLAPIPQSHVDLIDGPYAPALATLMPGGGPQATVVWCNRDGGYILLNTMRGFQKERNMRRDPRVALLVADPANPLRNIEVRGRVVAMTEEGAHAHNDALTMLYLGKPHFFGDAVPAELSSRFTPVICRVSPQRVRVEDGGGRPLGAAALALPGALGSGPIPASHAGLLCGTVFAVLVTLMPGGQPQASLVWCDYDGEDVLISTTLERQKGRNMAADPRVALLAIDPANSSRYVEVRGTVAEIAQAGAIDLADRLTQRYTGKGRFYGDIYPAEQRERETRVVCRIRPATVNTDAIFK
ncbi:MAG: TIGR03618 family F420-dependent PPOX class oxidoreductase [Caldilinea sp.]|nr:TIGR03618 family F420-dependent PPOX class oxidoreductase [Caldilinea sp.]